MSTFERAVDYVLENEGSEIVNNANDRGGITKYGISFRFLKSLIDDELGGSWVDENTIRNLSLPQAIKIYQKEFWDHAPFGEISNQIYCNYIFDMCINMGIAPAIKCVQHAILAVTHCDDFVTVDGILGNQTIGAIKMCGFLLMPALRAERAAYYRNLAHNNPKEKEFLNGWLKRTYKS